MGHEIFRSDKIEHQVGKSSIFTIEGLGSVAPQMPHLWVLPHDRATAQSPRKYMRKNSEVWYLYYLRSFSNLLYCKDKILSYKVKFLNHPSLTIRMFASVSVTATLCKFSDNRNRHEKECKARFRWFLRLDGVELPENIKKMDLNI